MICAEAKEGGYDLIYYKKPMEITQKYWDKIYKSSTIKNDSVLNIWAKICKPIIQYWKVVWELFGIIETEQQLDRLKNGEDPWDVLEIKENIF